MKACYRRMRKLLRRMQLNPHSQLTYEEGRLVYEVNGDGASWETHIALREHGIVIASPMGIVVPPSRKPAAVTLANILNHTTPDCWEFSPATWELRHRIGLVADPNLIHRSILRSMIQHSLVAVSIGMTLWNDFIESDEPASKGYERYVALGRAVGAIETTGELELPVSEAVPS